MQVETVDAPENSKSSAEDLLQGLGALVSRLRDEQAATEARGHYSTELHQALSGSGVYAMLRPARFGGLALDLPTYLKAIVTISSGCASTGLSVAAATSYALPVASLFPEAVQQAVFAAGVDVLVCTSADVLEALPGAGGWRLRGQWRRCDGAPRATWFLAPVLLPTHGDPAAREPGLALVPRANLQIVEDWSDVLGLGGSGSHSIALDTVVPAARVIRETCLTLTPPLDAPGSALHDSALYDGRCGSLTVRILCAVAVGIGHAALAWYEHALRTRTTPFPPKIPRSQEPNSQRFYGLALGMVTSAQAIMLEAAAQHMTMSTQASAGGARVSSEDELQLIARYHQAVNLCWQAVELLFATGGSSASRGDSQMTRYFRDLSALQTRNELNFGGYARALSRHHFAGTEARER